MSSWSCKEMCVQPPPRTSRESAFVAFSFVKIKHLRCSHQNLRENASVTIVLTLEHLVAVFQKREMLAACLEHHDHLELTRSVS